MLFSSRTTRRIRVLLTNKFNQGLIHGFNIDLSREQADLLPEDVKRITWTQAQKDQLVDDKPDNWRFVVIDY